MTNAAEQQLTRAPRRVLAADDVRRAITRMAHEVVERNPGVRGVAVVGIQNGGVWLADELASEIARIESGVAVGSVDASPFRDDLETWPAAPESDSDVGVDVDVDGATIVLVDDVLFTGRTVRAALDAVTECGRPRSVQLAVLVDRGHRELPIRPDFVGKNLPTSLDEDVLATREGVVIS